MILYYTLTKYQQLSSMVHKILFMPNEEAHLYLSTGNNIEPEYLLRLKESGIFTEVKILDDLSAWEMGASVDFEHEEKLYEVLDNITELCYQSLLRPINEYDELFILADHFPLGFVLAYKNIPYHYIEESCGQYCYYEVWKQKMLEQHNIFSYIFAKKIGCFGTAENVIDRYIDFDNQNLDYDDNKAIDFSISKLLKKIDQDHLNIILTVFNVDRINLHNTGKGLALILTEYLASGKVCTWEEQRMIYSMFIDYFCTNLHVLIKPHPNDHQGLYSVWFPEATIIDKNIIAELIPYYLNSMIDKVISLSSMSYKSLRESAIEIMSFKNKDLRSEKLFRSMNKYYIAAKMIEKIPGKYSIYGIGADMYQIRYFLQNDGFSKIEIFEYDRADLPEVSHRRIIVIDDLTYTEQLNEFDIYQLLDNAKDNDLFIYINSKNDVLFYKDDDNSWADYTVPISVDQIPFREGVEKKREWIYMITQDKELRYVFLNTRIERMLVNSGFQLKANDNTISVRERVLEGMLNATEQKCIMLTRRK